MIICVTGMYPVYDDDGLEDGRQFMVSHGYDPETDRTYPLPSVHPRELGLDSMMNCRSGCWTDTN